MKKIRKPKLWEALIPIIALIISLSVGIIVYDATPHIPLVIASCIAAIMALSIGFSWDEIERGFIDAIQMSMQSIIILMIIGMVIGSWILSGTVPTMIYYGLRILSPSIFLLATCIISSIVALATGSSWTTVGTVGIALLGVGVGLNIPAPLIAGAIISGAYFGDKMSPLSDTTNLAPAMAGTTLFEHIRHMFYTTVPSLMITLIIYGLLGLKYSGQALDTSQINSIIGGIENSFVISPILLLPPLIVIILVVKKVPAIPGLIIGIFAAGIIAITIQHVTFGELISTLNQGYVGESGVKVVDDLINRGGMQSMMSTVSLIICAMIFGGILEKAKFLEVISEKMLKFAVSTGSLVFLTIISCIVVNILAAEQYLSIVITGRMYKNEYKNRGLSAKNLSRALEDSGTLTSVLIPWNTCGAFISTTLGVPTLAYLPFCFLNLLNPIISIVYGYTGFSIESINNSESSEVNLESFNLANNQINNP